MLAYYVANDTQNYGVDVHQVINAITPRASVTEETLSTQYDYVVIEDSLSQEIAGFPNKLVIDTSGTEPLVREKNAAEYLDDAKQRAIQNLKQATSSLIKGVCDEDKQKSLSLLYPRMSTEDQTTADAYMDWHASMLSRYFTVKTAILNAIDQTALNAIATDLEGQFDVEMGAIPNESLNLSVYVL